MDKPVNLSIKEWIIRNMSVKTMVPERIIEEVINHQFIGAGEALSKYNSLEFSGFGKFYFNQRKAKYKLKGWVILKEMYENTLNDDSLLPAKRHNVEVRLASITKEIATLKPKIKEDD